MPELIEQMLDRYLDFAENAEPAYRLIMSGGLGNDPEATKHIAANRAKYREIFTEMVLPDEPEHPMLRLTFEGFLSFMEGATLDWLTRRHITREALMDLIIRVAGAVLHAAAEVDPSLRIHAPFADINERVRTDADAAPLSPQ